MARKAGLIDDMFETMRDHQGTGLAAPQVHAARLRWTAAEDEAVRAGRASGRTARDVGRAIGRSRDAVIHRAGALGLAVPRRRAAPSGWS